jgi:hypothetical protein
VKNLLDWIVRLFVKNTTPFSVPVSVRTCVDCGTLTPSAICPSCVEGRRDGMRGDPRVTTLYPCRECGIVQEQKICVTCVEELRNLNRMDPDLYERTVGRLRS